MTRTLLLSVPLLATLGCKKVDPAPRELDALLHWFWTEYSEGTDEELAEGIANLYDAVDAANFEELSDGSVSKLTKDEAALVGVTDRNPADASGVYLVNSYACTLGKLQPILLHKAQDELYDGIYDRYERDYTSSRADFEDRVTTTMGWEVEYDASLLGASYTANIVGGLRFLPALDDELSPHGPAMLARTHMPQPAEFESDNKSQDQDYQIEIWVKRKSGELLHVYGLWRQADFGSGFTSDDEGVQRILLNNLAAWDDDTEVLCAEGRP